MKRGIESAVGSLEFTVTPEMTARLDGREIHPVYSTFWACHHCEVAARRAIEPYFEVGENAVGSSLSLRHMAMAAVGADICVTARVERIHGNRIICHVQVTTAHTQHLLAEGTQEQVVLPDSKLKELVANALRA
jgi:fluoroacetyl-CoA thioesterase